MRNLCLLLVIFLILPTVYSASKEKSKRRRMEEDLTTLRPLGWYETMVEVYRIATKEDEKLASDLVTPGVDLTDNSTTDLGLIIIQGFDGTGKFAATMESEKESILAEVENAAVDVDEAETDVQFAADEELQIVKNETQKMVNSIETLLAEETSWLLSFWNWLKEGYHLILFVVEVIIAVVTLKAIYSLKSYFKGFVDHISKLHSQKQQEPVQSIEMQTTV